MASVLMASVQPARAAEPQGTTLRVGDRVEVLATDRMPFRVPILINHDGGSNAVFIGLDYDELMMRFTESWYTERGIAGAPWSWTHDDEQGTISLHLPFEAARGGLGEEAVLIELEFELRKTPENSTSYGYRASAQVSFTDSTVLEHTPSQARSRPQSARDGSVTIYLRDALEIGSARLTAERQTFRVPVYATHLEPSESVFLIGLDYDELFLDLLRVEPASDLLQGDLLRFGGGQGSGIQKHWVEAPFVDGRYPRLLRTHLLDLVFEYRPEAGVPPEGVLPIVPIPGGLIGGGDVVPVEVREGKLFFVAPSFLRGDANGSGDIDMNDALVILDHIFSVFGGSLSSSCLDSMNTDASLRVELTDAIQLLDYLYLGGAPPAAPFPEAGPAPPGSPILGCSPGDPEFEPLPRSDKL